MSARGLRRVCVFAGSRAGARPEYLEAASALGGLLATRGVGLVYGGASVGLMGALADAALDGGGEVIGVLPAWLEAREIAHRGLTHLHVVGSMHERKARMAELADAFVALPGGCGTLDELFETVTWAQIGLHQKPIGLLDVRGYWAPLVSLLAHLEAERFVPPEHVRLLLREAEPARLLDMLADAAAASGGSTSVDTPRT